MARFTQIHRRSNLPIILGAIAVAIIGFVAAAIFMEWQGKSGVQQTSVQILRPDPSQSGPIEVIDGDTVRLQGAVYRLVGFDTPERGDRARCDDERQRAEKATLRLRGLISSGNPRLTRVACACRPAEEGTSRCNYGRLCGVLTVGGRDAGQILISEGLAHSYVCGVTSCPRRRSWCEGR